MLALWALLGISLEHSTLKIDNMCFYTLKLLGRISFIVVNKFALLWGEAQKKIAYSYLKVT